MNSQDENEIAVTAIQLGSELLLPPGTIVTVYLKKTGLVSYTLGQVHTVKIGPGRFKSYLARRTYHGCLVGTCEISLTLPWLAEHIDSVQLPPGHKCTFQNHRESK